MEEKKYRKSKYGSDYDMYKEDNYERSSDYHKRHKNICDTHEDGA